MKTRKKIAALLALLFAVVGIVVIAPQSQAGSLAEGVHRAQRSCTGTMGNNVPFSGTLSATWKIEYLNHEPSPGLKTNYRFTLLDGLYTGTQYRPGAYPSVDVTAGSGGSGALYKSATNGSTALTSNAIFGDNWPSLPVGPLTLATVGTYPYTAPLWAPFTISTPDGAGNNWLRFNFGDDKMKNNCVFYVDLGLLNEPIGTSLGDANFPDCVYRNHDTVTGKPARSTSTANLIYNLDRDPTGTGYHLHTMVFTVKIPDYSQAASPPMQYYDHHTLTLHSGSPDLVSYLDPIGGIDQSYPSGEESWPDFGTNSSKYLQEAYFDYTDGDPPPYIEWKATNSQDPSDVCTQRWWLGVEYDDTGLDPDLNWENQKQVAFDDCQGGLGVVEINATWTTDFNEQYDKVKTLQVNNSSTNRITLEPYLNPGLMTVDTKSPQFKTFTPDRVWSVNGLGGSNAERIIAPLSSKTVDVTTASKWTALYREYAAPASIRVLAKQDYGVKMTLRAWIPKPGFPGQWIPCTAADVDLKNLELLSNTA